MLLVRSDRDSTAIYSRYLHEILRIEGFAAIEEVALEDLPERLASPVDGVILPRMVLPAATADRLAAWVRTGGRLIALHPDAILLRRLGFTPGYHQVVSGTLAFEGGGMLAGLPLEVVQVLVPTLAATAPGDNPVETLATLSPSDDPFSPRPAIWHATIGSGQAVLVAFDLAKAVARLRQGDPDLADMPNEIYDHIHRPSDLFRGQIPPQQAAIPQADVLTAVFGRIVEDLIPQPRLWYFPAPDQRGVFVQTSDDDWSTIEQFEVMTGVLRDYDAHCTFYVVERSQLTTDHLDRWEADGHTFSVHPANRADVNGLPPFEESQRLWVPEMVRENVARHREQYGRPVNTIRNHAIRWVGYVELARLFAELGIRGEANYFTMGPIPAGFMTGSGRLGRFVDTTGEMIDVYQIASHWTEEILVSDAHGFSERWLYSKGRAVTNGIITAAATRFHTPIVVNSHPVSFATYSRPLIESNWQTARGLGIPIVSADEWTAFTDIRNGVTISHDGSGWALRAGMAVPQASLLLPEGTSAPAGARLTSQTIWGRTYSVATWTDLPAGSTAAIPMAAGQAVAA